MIHEGMAAILSRNNGAAYSIVVPDIWGLYCLNVRPFQPLQECLRFFGSPTDSTNDIVEHPFLVVPVRLNDDGSTILFRIYEVGRKYVSVQG